MAEFIDKLLNSDELDTIFGYLLIFGFGLYFYLANWWLLFYNTSAKLNPEKKFVSMIPLLGGLLIAVGILIAGGGWWALIGLTDPSIWLFAYSIVYEFIFLKYHTEKEEKSENDGNNENNKSGE